MATYLQLCQQVHRNIRAGNNTPGSQPTAVAGQTDPLLLDIIYFVNEAYTQIQTENSRWQWMNNPATLVLPINTSTQYVQLLTIATIRALYTQWGNIVPYTGQAPKYCLIFDPNQTPNPPPPTQQPIYYVPWKEFNGYFTRQPRTQGQPNVFSEDPAGNIWFGQPPSAAPSGVAYQMKCDYRTIPQILAADSDVPLMPVDYHDLIVYWASFLYCQTRSSTSALMDACASNMQRLLGKLKTDQTPEWVLFNDFT